MDGFYYDIDANTNEFYKVKTLASYWALVAEIASKKQACKMAERVISPFDFGGDIPLSIDAFDRGVCWSLPSNPKGEIGIKNLQFGDVVVDIICREKTVTSNARFTLKINGKDVNVCEGVNKISL